MAIYCISFPLYSFIQHRIFECLPFASFGLEPQFYACYTVLFYLLCLLTLLPASFIVSPFFILPIFSRIQIHVLVMFELQINLTMKTLTVFIAL